MELLQITRFDNRSIFLTTDIDKSQQKARVGNYIYLQ